MHQIEMAVHVCIKLIGKLVSLNIMLLIDMYRSSSTSIIWNSRLSSAFHIFAGVWQGGSISPVILAVRVCIKLIGKLVSLNIMLLIDMYRSSSISIIWNNRLSSPFHIFPGVWQGGSISPLIFIVYLNSIINKLREIESICYIDHTSIDAIMYAGDLLLLSSSVDNLQEMVDMCLAQLQRHKIE
jgi:hypothetical protein